MNGNICPSCGKPVMNYRRFVTEAEPTKLFTFLYQCGLSVLSLVACAVVWVLMWVMLVNFLSWQLIRWHPVEAADQLSIDR